MSGTSRPFETLTQRAHADGGRCGVGIAGPHLAQARCDEAVDAVLAGEGAIEVRGRGVAREIVRVVELARVHEARHEHDVALGLRGTKE